MQIVERKVGDILVLKLLAQRLDASVAHDFKNSMTSFINAGNQVLVLNLSEVEFIDSSGLAAIISGLKTLGEKGEIVICEMNDVVTNIFKLTRLDRVFGLFKNEHDAINYLKNK